MNSKVIESVEDSSASDPSQASAVTTTYRLLVSVAGGLHSGAAFISEAPQGAVVGSSPECDVVLMDDGVLPRMVRMFVQNGALAVDVISRGVWLGASELPVGVRVLDEPAVSLAAGGASLRVELLRRTRRDAVAAEQPAVSQAAAASAAPRAWTTFAMAGICGAVVLVLVLVGGAVGASAHRGAPSKSLTLSAIVDGFNKQGAQITVEQGSDGRPQLRGLIGDAQARVRLDGELRSADLRPDVQLHDVHQMGESLSRLVRLEGQDCKVNHLGGGRFECDAGVATQPAVERLRALKDDVPGVVSFDVRSQRIEPVAPPVAAPVPAAKVAPAPRPAVIALPIIRHVAVGEKVSFAIDASGRRLRVGDQVDGSKVQRIQFDAVVFVRDGQRYTVGVTPMLTVASGGPTTVAVKAVPAAAPASAVAAAPAAASAAVPSAAGTR